MTDASLGYLISETLFPSKDAHVCDCPGGRPFEMLDEPPVLDSHWHVCPCCGTRKLIPEVPQ